MLIGNIYEVISPEDMAKIIQKAKEQLELQDMQDNESVWDYRRRTGSCACDCHSQPGMRHMMPCCDRTYQQF